MFGVGATGRTLWDERGWEWDWDWDWDWGRGGRRSVRGDVGEAEMGSQGWAGP